MTQSYECNDVKIVDEDFMTYNERIGSDTDEWNGKKGCIKYINLQQVQISIWNRSVLDRPTNIFTMIKTYLSIRPETD